MTAQNDLAVLQSEIADGLSALAIIESFITSYEKDVIGKGKKELEQALALSQALGNYYTCLETIFFRISQYFENNLSKNRWHQDLLQKMMLAIVNIRPAVISRETADLLGELLSFRHFTRYYYSLDYDWDKLDYLLGKFNAVRSGLRREIEIFSEKLKT